jgi:serine/threonine protein kinase
LYPETYDSEFCAVDDELSAGQIQREEIEEAYIPSEFTDDLVQATKRFRSVHPSQVEIYQYPEHGLDAPDAPDASTDRTRVAVDGQAFFFKSTERTGVTSAMGEIKKFSKIPNPAQDLRISRLYGIIQDERDPFIGLLFYHIDQEGPLSFVVKPDTPADLKERWSAQITNTLATLHDAGVVWGDAKADNVLIDKNNDAWVIDFEGAYTRGWVDREKAGTVEGDLQGSANIVRFIFNTD